MKSPRARSASVAFFLHSVDQLGRTIDPLVLAIAHEIGPRAVAYGDRLLGDAALAINLFEESAGAVSEALKRKTKDAKPVQDLTAYLYRTFVHKVSLTRGKRARLETSLRENARTQVLERQAVRLEITFLFDEVMASYDKVTQDIVYRRLEGYSWKEIATDLGLSTHATEARYSRALARARLLLGTRRAML